MGFAGGAESLHDSFVKDFFGKVLDVECGVNFDAAIFLLEVKVGDELATFALMREC